jgi:hypothetical protein
MSVMQKQYKVVGVFSLLLLIALVPLLLGHYVFNHADRLHIKKRNHGQLIQAVSVADLHVGSTAISHWSGRWLLVYNSNGKCCNKSCRLEMHQLHQVRIALHNGIERTRVALLLPERCAVPSLESSDLVWKQSKAQASAWKKRIKGASPQVLVIDPNSLAMLKYSAKEKPQSIYEDMRILLHTSQIG